MSSILITIPTWNEERIIARTLERVIEFAKVALVDHEVAIEVADNASTDRTRDIVNDIIGRGEPVGSPGLVVRLLAVSDKGKGLAIRSSWMCHVDDMDILLFTDADLSADLSIIPQMLRLILDDDADIVCASRFVLGANVERRWLRETTSRLFRRLQQWMLGLQVQDAQCGLKAVSTRTIKECLLACQETGWLFDTELLALAQAQGLKTREIPVIWREQPEPSRRSALRLYRDGWGFLLGLAKIKYRLALSFPRRRESSTYRKY